MNYIIHKQTTAVKPQLYLTGFLQWSVICMWKCGFVFVPDFPPEFYSHDGNAFEAFKVNTQSQADEILVGGGSVYSSMTHTQ